MEKEMQEELVLDLPELLAMYLRKGILILACSCIFGILFASLRTLRRGIPARTRRKRVRLIRIRP